MAVIIPSPCVREIERCLEKWDTLENYVLQENSLRKLFQSTYPGNDAIEDVLIKVCALNDFYSTNIYSPFTIAKHIVSLQIDRRLEANDLSLVNDIALVVTGTDKVRNFYSFASKYCSHHKPEVFPIYDFFVEKTLVYFSNEGFGPFNKNELKSYPGYLDIILRFRDHYGLDSFSLKEIDKYLWMTGKEYFPKNYKRQARK